MLLTNLVVLAAVPSTLAAWSDFCRATNSYGTASDGVYPATFSPIPDHLTTQPLTLGVCLWASECGSSDGGATTFTAGRCPNDPADVKCCWAAGCAVITHGKCPGGDEIKCWESRGECWEVASGQCPGGTNYKKLVKRYFGADNKSVSC